MDEQVKYTEQEVANLSQALRGFLRPVQHELHEQGMSVTWILPEVDWETLAESILQRDAAVRAEAQQALTDAQGEVKRLRARFGAVDGRLAAAEKLGQAADALMPHMWEPKMKGESDYERALIAFHDAFVSWKEAAGK